MKRVTFEIRPVAGEPGVWYVEARDENDVLLTGASGQSCRLRIVKGDKGAVLLPDAPPDPATDDDIRNARVEWVLRLMGRYRAAAQSDDRYQLMTQEQNPRPLIPAIGKHLFDCLIGQELWDKISTTPTELALRPVDPRTQDRTVVDLLSLPWEALHTGSQFVASLPGFALTRRLRGGAPLEAFEGRLRVLFIIGTYPDDPAVRPGAEFYGLLRSLRPAAPFLPGTRLIDQARRSDILIALKAYRPHVVHFICHGGIDTAQDSTPQEPFIELCDEREPRLSERCDEELSAKPEPLYTPDRVRADDLVGLFEQAGVMPRAVVLNACSSAAATSAGIGIDAPDLGRSFAERLVRAKIPMVVGMAGKVTDQACRLFTRKFYFALLPVLTPEQPEDPALRILEGESPAQASALGRRAGILQHELNQPDTSLDWALPILFLSDEAEEARFRTTLPAWELEAEETARRFAYNPYPSFCGRVATISQYSRLMMNDSLQGAANSVGMGVVALRLQVPYPGGTPVAPGITEQLTGRIGVHRLMAEIAMMAVRDGHIPICVTRKTWPNEKPPITGEELFAAIRKAIVLTASNFSVDTEKRRPEWSMKWLDWVQELKKREENLTILPPPNELTMVEENPEREKERKERLAAFEEHPACWEIRNTFKNLDLKDPGADEMKAIALRQDLLALREVILRKRGREAADSSAGKLVLLIPRVHEMDVAAGVLFRTLLSEFGVRHPSAVRFFRTIYSLTDKTVGEVQARALREMKDANQGWYLPVTLDTFRTAEEWHGVYLQHLLYWETKNREPDPLTLKQTGPYQMMAEGLLNYIHMTVGGIPSLLAEDKLRDLVEGFRKSFGPDANPLQAATDEDVLRQAK